VANYNIDIGVKVKAQQLDQFNKKIKSTTDLIKNANNSIKNYQKGNLELVRSINGVNTVLSTASKNFKEVAVGTPQATRAAKEFVKAEQLVNKTLAEQEKLLETVRRKQQGKEFTMSLRTQGFKKNQIRQSDGSFINMRRQELQIINRAATLDDRINQILLKRGKILSANGKQIINNNRARSSGIRGGGLTNAIGSGIIGGGFPLLFGQGATAALGGGIGGVAGGLIGGQFGFALSIAGTTIGSALDQLSKALLKPTENIEMLVNRLGLAGTETGDLALRLQKLGLESDAAELLLKEFETRFGLTADEIKENSETLKNFNNEINKLGTSLTLMMANVLNPLIKELNNLIKGKRPEGISRGVTGTIDFFTSNMFDLDKRGGILDPAFKKSKMGNIPSAEGNAVIGGVSLNPAFGTNPNFSGTIKAKKDLEKTFLQQKEILPLQQALEIEKDRLKLTKNQITFKQEEFKLDNLKKDLQFLESQRTDEINQDLELKIRKLRLNISLQQTVLDNLRKEGFELDELSKKFMDIGASIEKSIVGNLTDAVMGTQSLGQAAVNVLNNLKRKLIEVQIEQAVAGIGDKVGGFLGSLFKKRERGGPVAAGGAYLVGEKGPEILQMGSRGGNIIPNNKIEGGTTNMVTVNVDASGSSVAGSNADAQALGAVIGAAVQAQLIKEKRPGGLLTR